VCGSRYWQEKKKSYSARSIKKDLRTPQSDHPKAIGISFQRRRFVAPQGGVGGVVACMNGMEGRKKRGRISLIDPALATGGDRVERQKVSNSSS